jgi:hypothetical protein
MELLPRNVDEIAVGIQKRALIESLEECMASIVTRGIVDEAALQPQATA